MIEARINSIQDKFLALFQSEREAIAKLPTSEIIDLQHRAVELSNHDDYSLRVASEIIRASCILILENRQPNGGSKSGTL